MTQRTKAPFDPGEIPPLIDFPHAPSSWLPEHAVALAANDLLVLTEDHWTLIAALQEYFMRNAPENVRLRDLHDALKEKFHTSGGGHYLYHLFPGGPVAQGCPIAGLTAPAGSVDRSYGSVS